MNTKLDFKSPMFVYAAENSNNSSNIKVIIPEVFLIDKNSSLLTTKSQKGNTSIFINKTIPALRPYVERYNYIELPIICSSHNIRKGERLMAEFVNNNPKYGVIIARC